MTALSPDALARAPVVDRVPSHIYFGERHFSGSVYHDRETGTLSLSFAQGSLADCVSIAHWMTPARAREIAAALVAQADAAEPQLTMEASHDR